MADSDNEIDLSLDTRGSPEPTGVPGSATTTGTATASVEGSMAPPQPTDDLAFIQSLVDQGAVVGSLPPVSMSAAEKRREVEASMGLPAAPSVPDAQAADDSARTPADATAPRDEDMDSDSSSEWESSDDDDKPPKPAPTLAEQAVLKSQLDKFVGMEFMSDSEESDEDEDEDDYDLAGKLGGFGMEVVDDSDDDAPQPVTSVHEVPLPPVPQPPVNRLDEGTRMLVAGDVVSWMKEKAVENWRAKAAEEATGIEEDKAEPTVEGESATKEPTKAAPDAEEVTHAPSEESKADADMAAAAKIPTFNSSGTVIIRAQHADGWLEADSILCYSDRRVLGTVADTFGPLTSPFYLVRLPPPPFPYPSAEDLAPGTKVYVPSDPQYRKFVDMAAVRDPRFRSDASNVYDEEVGDDEVEWSDDEAEAAARRRKKKGKGKGRDAKAQHFDYAGEQEGGEAGGRRLVNYDDQGRGGRGGRVRGRGGARGGGGGQGRPIAGRTPHALPPRPVAFGAPGGPGAPGYGQQQPQGYMPYAPAGYNPAQASLGMPAMGMQMPMGMGMGQMGQMGQMGMGMPMMGQMGMGYPGYEAQGQQQQSQQGQQDGAPAINPRFAHMMGMGGMGYWPGPGQQGPNQGQ